MNNIKKAYGFVIGLTMIIFYPFYFIVGLIYGLFHLKELGEDENLFIEIHKGLIQAATELMRGEF